MRLLNHVAAAVLEAISETLSKEVRDFGIRVSAIAPGQFRTDWAGRSMIRTERTISDYDKLMDPVRKARQDKSGKHRIRSLGECDAINGLCVRPAARNECARRGNYEA